MKKRLNQQTKGFILIESLVSLTILAFTLLNFYVGQNTFLLQIKKQQVELTGYRVLYEEVAAIQTKLRPQAKSYLVTRNGQFQIDMDFNQSTFVSFSTMNQSVAIFREK